MGIRVPEDVSVIGIDDILISRMFVPSLTTVQVDHEEIGRLGMDLLMRKLEKQPVESITISSGKLIQRESTRMLTE